MFFRIILGEFILKFKKNTYFKIVKIIISFAIMFKVYISFSLFLVSKIMLWFLFILLFFIPSFLLVINDELIQLWKSIQNTSMSQVKSVSHPGVKTHCKWTYFHNIFHFTYKYYKTENKNKVNRSHTCM